MKFEDSACKVKYCLSEGYSGLGFLLLQVFTSLFELNRRSLYFIIPVLFIVMEDRGHQIFLMRNWYASFLYLVLHDLESIPWFTKYQICIFSMGIPGHNWISSMMVVAKV